MPDGRLGRSRAARGHGAPRWAARLAAFSVAALIAAANSVLAAPATARQPQNAVSMAVVSMTPSTPTITTTKPQPLTIELSLSNPTAEQLNLTITGVRGAPYTSPQALDAALADPKPPTDFVLDIATAHPVHVALPPGATRSVNFVTTTSTTQDAGICLCTAAGVYPLYFTASANGEAVAGVQTYLPAFYAEPTPIHVAWLWPLLERPHRLLADNAADNLFLDDDLAASISGGRLDRALQTVEAAVAASPRLALTLVVDPELLDELQVMASGPYRVQPPGKPVTPGVGTQAAAAWLGRLRTLLASDPSLELVLTPLGDPDYEQLTSSGLPWSALLPDALHDRVATALGGSVPSARIAWPVSGAVHADTLAAMAGSGVSTVLLGSDAVRAADLPTGAAPLTIDTKRGSVHLLPTSADVSTAVSNATLVGGQGAGGLPALVAQLAARVAQDPAATHDIVVVPPRLVDASPDDAARAITETTSAFWTRSTTVTDLVGAQTGDAPLRVLASPTARSPHLAPLIVASAQAIAATLPTLASLLGSDNAVVTQLPTALQRVESGAWIQDRGTGERYAALLQNAVSRLERGVFIVRPSSGTYTLGSNNSPLPLTVQNNLNYPVHVVIHVETVNGLPGFQARDVTKTIDPHTKTPIPNLRASLIRNGRIEVQAVLRTPSGAVIGTPVALSVRKTALGRIGLIITVVSGTVLAIALMRRFWMLYRRRGTPPTVPDEPVATAGVA